MSKLLGNIVKLVASLGLGILIVWITIRQLTPADIAVVRSVFSRTTYIWIFVSAALGVVANVVRAERWRLLLQATGYEPSRINLNHSINVMNIGNLLFPRLGEVMRCTLLLRTDGVPVDRSIGTMVVERVVDVICMFLAGALAIALDYTRLTQLLRDKVVAHISLDRLAGVSLFVFIVLGLVLIVFAFVAFWLLRRMRGHSFIVRILGFVKGLLHGLLSIARMERPWLFFLYSAILWWLYTYSILICYRSLPELYALDLASGFAIIFFGTIAFIVAQGGIGAYPAAVGLVLAAYGISYEVGFAFGWLIWIVQTASVLICGVVSLFLVSKRVAARSTT